MSVQEQESFIDELRGALEKFESDDVMDVSAADGYLTALALLPDMPTDETIYAPIFSFDEDHALTDEEKAVLPLLQKNYQLTKVALDAGHGFEPIIFPFIDDNDKPILNAEGVAAVGTWVTGFYSGMSTWAADELEADPESFAPVLRFLEAEDFDEEHREEAATLINDFKALDTKHKVNTLIEALQLIVESVYALKKSLNPNTPLVKNAPEVGRNDPCPCGSGKKYKKCCGAK